MIRLGALQGDVTINGADAAMGSIRSLVEELGRGGASLTEFERGMQNIAGTLDKIGNDLTTKVTLPIVGVGTASFKMAADFAETLSKVDVVFESSAKEIKDWGDTTLEQYGLAKSTSLEMVSYFGDMGTSMQLPIIQAKEMAVSLTELSADMASFKNISVDRAQTALAAVYTGETEALKSLGVVMTVANLEAYAMSEGITKAYKDMTQAEQVTLRYNYVMQATSNAHGDFARTSESASNQLRVLVESLKELSLEFGEEIIPLVLPIIEHLKDMVQGFSDLDEASKKNIVTFGLVAASLGPISKAISGVITGIMNLSKAIGFLSAHPIVATLTAVTGVFVLMGVKVAETNNKLKATTELIDELNSKDLSWLKDNIKTIEDTVGKYEEYIDTLKEVEEQLESLEDEENNIRDAYRDGSITLEEHDKRLEANANRTKSLSDQQTALNKSVTLLSGEIISQYGTIDKGIECYNAYKVAITNAEESQRILEIATNNTKDTIMHYNNMLMDGSTETTNKVINDVQLKIEAMQREASAALVVAGGYKGMVLEKAGLMSEEMSAITRHAEEKYNIMQAEIGEMERYLEEVRGMHSERVQLNDDDVKDTKRASSEKKKALEDDTKVVEEELNKQLDAYSEYMDGLIAAKQEEISILKSKKQEELDALKEERAQRDDKKKLEDLEKRLEKEELAKIESERKAQEKIEDVRKELEEASDEKQRERLRKRLKDAENDKVEAAKRGEERINEAKDKINEFHYEQEYNAKIKAVEKQYDKELEIAQTEMNNLKKVRDTHVDTITKVWEEEFKNSGKVCGETFVKEFNTALDAFLKKKLDITVDITSKSRVDGSHRNGLDYVPFDGYLAELHKGERVLTEAEADYYNEGTPTTLDTASLEDAIQGLRSDIADINKTIERLPAEQQRLGRMGVI